MRLGRKEEAERPAAPLGAAAAVSDGRVVDGGRMEGSTCRRLRNCSRRPVPGTLGGGGGRVWRKGSPVLALLAATGRVRPSGARMEVEPVHRTPPPGRTMPTLGRVLVDPRTSLPAGRMRPMLGRTWADPIVPEVAGAVNLASGVRAAPGVSHSTVPPGRTRPTLARSWPAGRLLSPHMAGGRFEWETNLGQSSRNCNRKVPKSDFGVFLISPLSSTIDSNPSANALRMRDLITFI